MSVTNESNKVSYVSSGLTSYSVPFPFTDTTHVKLYIDDVLQVSGYSVVGSGSPAGSTGGTMTLSPAPAVSAKITILRDVPFKQDNTFNENGPFLAKTIEAMFDKLTFITQQLNEKVVRAVKFPLTSNVNSQMTGTVVPRGMLVFDATGTALECGPDVDTFAQTVQDNTDSSAASAAAALASQNAAATSEANALASQNAAATSEANALGSKNAAATSETNAATSATNAAASQTAAATSATNAATSEANALTYKNAANTSATNAATSEANALTYKNAAQTSANNAGTSETNAAASASSAAANAALFDPAFYATQNVTAGGTVTTNSNKQQNRKVQGNAGAVTLSSTPFGTTPPSDGTTIRLVGQSDTNTVGLTYSDVNHGVLLNGDCDLKRGNVLTLIFDLTALRWYEISRNF